MNSIVRRIERMERRITPSPQTEFGKDLIKRMAAGRQRVITDREAHGISDPSDDGLPTLRLHHSRGIQLIIDILHDGRDDNRRRFRNWNDDHRTKTTSQSWEIDGGKQLWGRRSMVEASLSLGRLSFLERACALDWLHVACILPVLYWSNRDWPASQVTSPANPARTLTKGVPGGWVKRVTCLLCLVRPERFELPTY